MTDSKNQSQNKKTSGSDAPPAADGRQENRRNRGEKRGGRRDRRGQERDSEWQERVVQISRVSKTVKGGKKMSFRAIVVVGNEK